MRGVTIRNQNKKKERTKKTRGEKEKKEKGSERDGRKSREEKKERGLYLSSKNCGTSLLRLVFFGRRKSNPRRLAYSWRPTTLVVLF